MVSAGPLREVEIDDLGGGQVNNTGDFPPDEPEQPREEVFARIRAKYPQILRACLARQVVVLLAGRAADLADPADLGSFGSSHDLAEADALADSAVGRRDRRLFLNPLRETANAIVLDCWPTVVDLAAWLVRERRIDGDVAEGWTLHQPDALRLQELYSEPLATPSVEPSDGPPVENPSCPPRSSLRRRPARTAMSHLRPRRSRRIPLHRRPAEHPAVRLPADVARPVARPRGPSRGSASGRQSGPQKAVRAGFPARHG